LKGKHTVVSVAIYTRENGGQLPKGEFVRSATLIPRERGSGTAQNATTKHRENGRKRIPRQSALLHNFVRLHIPRENGIGRIRLQRFRIQDIRLQELLKDANEQRLDLRLGIIYRGGKSQRKMSVKFAGKGRLKYITLIMTSLWK
jgi:hypothetical protein